QAAEDESLVAQAFDIRSVAVLVVADFGECRIHAAGQVQHTVASVAEARTGWVDMGKGRRGVRAAGNAEGYFRAGYQLETSGLVLQPGVGQGLQLIQRFEFAGIGYIVEQRDGWEFGVDQSVGPQMGFGPHRELVRVYHCAPRRLSMRRNDSYKEIMSPWAMTSSGDRPLKNSLWLAIEGKPYTFSGLSKSRRRAAWMLRMKLMRCIWSASRLTDHASLGSLARTWVLREIRRMLQDCSVVACHFSRIFTAARKPAVH